MDVKEIRKINLRALLKKAKRIDFAEEVGTSPAYLSQILSKKTKAEIGDELARRIEARKSLPRGWMDTLDHRDRQRSLETGKMVDDFEHLPDGLKEHVARKIAELRAYADALPGFIRDGLRPPRDPDAYRQWEREMEADMHTKHRSR